MRLASLRVNFVCDYFICFRWSICKGIRIGKILIQSDMNQQPRLFYLNINKDFAGRHVLLLDPTLASGASSQMAIRVLLDHGVPEENILFITVIAAPRGLHLLAHSYPKVTIVTSAVDPGLNEHGHIIPGMGNYSDRYFGTETTKQNKGGTKNSATLQLTNENK